MKATPEELLREFAVEMAYLRAEVCFMGKYEVNKLADAVEIRLNALLDKLMPTEEECEQKLKLSNDWSQSYVLGFDKACEWFRSRMKGEGK